MYKIYRIINNMSAQTFINKPVGQLLYGQSPVLLEAITERRPDKIYPKGARSAVDPGDTIEFEIQTDAFTDLSTATFDYTLAFVTPGTDTNISNAADVVKNIDTYYNEVNLERLTEVPAWTNMLIQNNAVEPWVKSEANVLIGLTNQLTSGGTSATTTYSKGRDYSVPLVLVSGFARCRNFIPVLGNRIRISIQLAAAKDFITYDTLMTNVTYTLSNVCLSVDTIITKQDYKEMVLEAMASGDGLRLPYTTLACNSITCTASTIQNLRISTTYTNALSLFMLHDTGLTGKPNTPATWVQKNQSFALNNFSSLRVRAGTRLFTPPDDITTYPQLYTALEKCFNSLGYLHGSGYLDYATYVGTYTPNTNKQTGVYGTCPIGINLEKAIEDDDAVINNGFSSTENGSAQFFDVQLKTTSNLAATSTILTAIAHKRALVFSSAGTQVEF